MIACLQQRDKCLQPTIQPNTTTTNRPTEDAAASAWRGELVSEPAAFAAANKTVVPNEGLSPGNLCTLFSCTCMYVATHPSVCWSRREFFFVPLDGPTTNNNSSSSSSSSGRRRSNNNDDDDDDDNSNNKTHAHTCHVPGVSDPGERTPQSLTTTRRNQHAEVVGQLDGLHRRYR